MTTAAEPTTVVGLDSMVASQCAKKIVDDLYADGRLDGKYPAACFGAALRLFSDTMRGPSGIGMKGEIRRARVLQSVRPAWLRAATTEALRLSFGDPIPSRVDRISYPRKLAVVLSFDRWSVARVAVARREHRRLAAVCCESASTA